MMEDKFDLNKTMQEMDAKMDELKAKMQMSAASGREAVKDAVDTAQGQVNHWGEKSREFVDDSKSKLSSALIKAQMTIRAQKEELEDRIAKKRYENARDKAKDEAEDAAEYAEAAMEFAMMALDEAKLAFLTAVEKQMDYDEVYGNDK